MITTVIEYCEKNSNATAGIGAFAIVLGKVKDKRKKIDELNEKEGKWSVGVTEDTNGLRERMSGLALKCANGTSAYAYSINNNTLAALVDFNEDDLRLAKKDEVDDVCQGIHDAALASAAEVVNFGISGADIGNLQGLIDEYRQKMQNPRQAIITKSQANKKVKELVREIIDVLLEKQLDLMVNTLKGTNFGFWSGYQMARNIIDRGIVHSKVKGVVRDTEDVPLIGIRFIIYDTETKKVVKETVSEKKGLFKVSPMAVGNFDFKWEMEGFVTKTQENVRVGAGKVVRRQVSLKRI